MKTHELKTVNPFFDAVWRGIKTFEVRENDRGFQVGDFLSLKEYSTENMLFSGRCILAEVTYILSSADFGIIRHGFVVMALVVISKTEGQNW